MKIAAAQKEIESSGLAQQQSFQIKASAKAFKILSDGLYSDKIRAVIRELSCNAYDAHVAAGNSDPFEVHLPNTLEPHFSVKDFGTGLSHDDVMNLYTTYFASTKTDSNDFIGALGLGSKSPFSYIDQFTVKSRFNGNINEYVAFIDQNGAPAIALLSSSETNEPNGVEVSMPVNSGDFYTFAEKAKDVFKYFQQAPKIVGANIEIVKPTYNMEGVGWKLNSGQRSYYAQAGALMGNVRYPIESGSIKGINYDIANVLKANVDFIFNLGDLEVQPSREGLSYDDRTSKTLISAITKFRDDIQKNVQDEIDTCGSLWDATTKYASICNSLSFSLSKITYNGTQVDYTGILRVDRSNIKGKFYLLSTYDFDKQTIIREGAYSTKSFYPNSYNRIYWHDGKIKVNRVLKYINETDPPDSGVIVIYADSEQERDNILNAIGNPPYDCVNLADIQLPPKPPKIVNGKKVRDYTRCIYKFNGNSMTDEFVDLKQNGGYYVNCFDRVPSYNGYSIERYDIYNMATTFVSNTIDTIYGIPATMKDSIKQYPNWINLTEAVIEKLKLDVQNNGRQLGIKSKLADLNLRHDFHFSTIKDLKPSAKDFDKNGLFGKILEILNSLNKELTLESNYLELACRLLKYEPFKVAGEIPDVDIGLDKLLSKIEDRYPLIHSCKVYTYSSYLPGDKKHWVEYINLIDKEKQNVVF